MMTKEDIVKIVYNEYERINGTMFPYDIIFSKRMTSALGSVKYKNKKVTKLTFSERLLKSENNEAIYEVIIHELTHIHTVENNGYASHDKLFFDTHYILFNKRGSKYADIEKFGFIEKYKYTIKCSKCNQEYPQKRENRYVKLLKRNMSIIVCSKCKGSLFLIENGDDK